MKKYKQRIDKSEPYFVHIGYTFVNEMKRCKRPAKYRYKKLKITPAKQARIDKLERYWKAAL